MSEIGQITLSPRVAIHRELEDTRQRFHALLDSLDDFDLYLPSANPAWTIAEVLYHIVLGLAYVPLEVKALQLGLRTPQPSIALFDRLNPLLTRMAAQRQNRQSLAAAYDRQHACVIQALQSIKPTDWYKGRHYPSYDPPILDGFVHIQDLFHYPAQHLEAHQQEILYTQTLLAQADAHRLAYAPDDFIQQEQGLMTYPTSRWRKAFFKAPITLWRLGFGRLLGKIFLLITHTGRNSRLPRRTLVEYHALDGVTYVPCAFGTRTDWYQNIQADPFVTIQYSRHPRRVQAVRVTDDRELLAVYTLFMRRDPPIMKWYLQSLEIQPNPADVLLKKDRIYWLRFDPTEAPTPPPLKADLAWIWLFALAGGLVAYLFTHRKR